MNVLGRPTLSRCLRLLSILDGISYVLLLGIAMPLKYLAGQPLAVSIVGMAHGVLYIGLCLFLLLFCCRRWLPLSWGLLVFVCAFIPLAPFFLDRHLGRALRPAS